MPDYNFRVKGVGQLDVSSITASLSKVEKAFSSIQVSKKLQSNFQSTFTALEKEIDNFNTKMQGSFKNKGDVSSLSETAKKISALFTQLETDVGKAYDSLSTKGSKGILQFSDADTKKLQQLDSQIKQVESNLKNLSNQKVNLSSILGDFSTSKAAESGRKIIETYTSGMEGSLESALKQIDVAIQRQQSAAKSFGTTSNIQTNISTFENLRQAILSVEQQSGSLNNQLNSLQTDRAQVISNAFQTLQVNTQNAANSLAQTRASVDSTTSSLVNAKEAQQQFNSELDQLKTRVTYFFSLQNSVNLFRKAVSNAFQTVKELDSAMTETAVVTDFSVGDMWDQLPRYTEIANELGASIQGAYETMTLYYQQGLDMNQTFEVGTETMKMARIAGMDYAETTNLMTSALRGFNMEINTTSAKRINDVYSELAAITASDTQEIATAMTKTASIADSANMEFETTAAFLAQMIETTREPAENLGTAMKSIIARFQEMKEAPGDLVDVDGETISVNKVDAALKSVGVSLKDANGQFRDLDDVFMDLAERWDSLDMMQQRYVATTAAGSRQQSRFIAMMSNYQRTVELVDAAYNSAGSSDKQFEKTLDSLEAKLNRLQSAWQQFTMGIANSTVIKGAIDIMTALLTVINNLTEKLGPVGGAIAKIAVAWSALKIGKTAFNGVFKAIGSAMGVAGTQSAQQFQQGLSKGFAKLSVKDGAQIKTFVSKLQKQINSSDFVNVDMLKASFEKVPATLQATMMSAAPKAVTALSSSLETSILSHMDDTDDEVRMWVEDIKAEFEKDLTTAGLDTAIANATKKVGEGFTRQTLITDANGNQFVNTEKKTVKDGWQKDWGLKQKEAQGFANSMRDISQATGAAGSALMNFSMILRQLGLGKAADAVGTLGTALMSLGGVISSVISLVSVLGGWVTAGLAAVAVAIGIITAVVVNSNEKKRKASVEYRLEQATEQTEKAKEAADKAKESYDDLLSEQSSYNELQSALDDLVPRTQEWADKLAEANQQVLELLQNFPTLAQYINNNNGRLEISDEGWDEVTSQQRKNAQQAQVAYYATELAQTGLQREKATSDYRSNKSYIENEGFVSMADTWASYATEAKIGFGWDAPAKALLETVQNAFTKAIEEGGGKTAEEIQASAQKELESTFLTQGFEDGYEEQAAAQAQAITDKFFLPIYTDLQQYNEKMSELDLQEDAQKLSLVSTALENADLGDFSGQIQEIILSLFDPDKYALSQDQLNKINSKDESALVTQYADLYGMTEDAVSEMFESYEDADERVAAIKQGVISKLEGNQIIDAVQGQLDKIQELIAGSKSSEAIGTILNILSGRGENLSADQLNSLGNKTGASKFFGNLGPGVSTGDISAGLGYDSLKDFWDAWDSQAAKILTQRATAIGRLSEQAYGLFETGTTNSQDKIAADKDLLDLLNKLDINQQVNTANTVDSLRTNFGSKAATQYYSDIYSLLENNDLDNFQAVSNAFSSIDFSNPIEAAAQLKDGLSSINPVIQETSAQLISLGYDSLNAGEQFKYFFQSSDYEDLADDIEKAKEENGKLTPDNIREMAKSSKTLSKLMDNLNVSAKTTADLFNAIGDGSLGFDDLTDSVINLLESTNAFEATLDDTMSLIENFDPGRDEGKVGEFVQSLTESVEEMWKNGEFGNTQLQNYLKLMFGEDAWNKALSDAGGNLEHAEYGFVKRLGVIEDNLYGAWEDLAKNYKKGQDAASEALGKKLSVSMGKAGDIILDVGEATTDETVQWLANAYQVSEEYAEMMLTDFSNYSADLQAELKRNDWNAGIADYVSGKQTIGKEYGFTDTTGTGQAVYSDKEIQSISAATGKSTTEIWSDIYTQMSGVETEFGDLTEAYNAFAQLTNKPLYFDLIDDDGIEKTGEKLQEAISVGLNGADAEAYDWIKNFAANTSGEIQSISYETASSFLSSIGIAAEDIPGIIQEAAENSHLPITINGEEVDASELPEKLEEAAAQAQYGDAAQVFANAMVTAFADQTGLGTTIKDQIIEGATTGTSTATESINSVDASGLQNNISNAISNAASQGASSLRSAINSVHGTVGISFKLGSSGIKIGDKNVSFSLYAKGSPKIKDNQIGILGDGGGPELLISKNGESRLVGLNGPEAAVLQRGDQILTAEETKKVFHGNVPTGSVYPAFAQGYRRPISQTSGTSGKSGGSSGSSSGGSSGSDETEEWENSFDWLYNLTEDINEQLRIREKLEKRYSRILRDETKSISALSQNIYAQIDSLEAQQALQEKMYEKRKFEMEEALKAYSDISDYATYNWEDNTIEIDWGKIDSVTDTELGDRIEEYVDHLERIQDAMDDAEDSLEEIIDEIQDLKDEGKDEYSSFEEKVMDAYVQREQEKIDTLTDLDSHITDANSKLLSSIQSSLSKIRQDRDNQKTEEDLASKERRLAYLRQDTSGANALEIKELEKELEESRQDYTDSLVDQKISELQEQNDRASEERQQQIELLQAQLDFNQKNGEYWPKVYELMMTGINDQSQLVKGSELESLFHNADEWDGMSGIQKMAWLEEINQEIKEGFSWLMRNSDASAIARQYENSFDKNTDYQAIINKAVSEGDYLTAAQAEQRRNAKIDALGLDQEKTFKYQKYLTSYDKNVDYQAKINEALKNGDYLAAAMYEQQRNAKIKGEGRKEAQTNYYRMYLTDFGLDMSKYGTSTTPTKPSTPSTQPSTPSNENSSQTTPRVGSKVSIKDTAKNYGGDSTNVAIPNWVKQTSKNGYTVSAINSSKGEALIQELYSWVKLADLDIKQYKTGGLVDSTGLSWLDGTKTAPELVLNARDTENFIALKDVLGDFLKRDSSGTSNNEGVNINVDIQVDKIGSDYDVDRMVERVKKSINQDARYRNINALTRLSR